MPARTASKRALLLSFVLGNASETIAATTPSGMTLFYSMNVPTPEGILKVFVEEVGKGSTGDKTSTISNALSRVTIGALVLIAGK